MSVGFSTIPNDLRVPLFYAEVDNSAANSAEAALRRLIVAQVNDELDPLELGELVLVSSLAQAKLIGGQGSMLAAMYETLRRSDPMGEVWVLPVAGGAGAAASGVVTVTGAATASGLLVLAVGGQRITAPVVKDDDAAAVGLALASAINAAPDLPVKAAAAAGVVTLTCKWSGESGNDIGLVLNPLGRTQGDVTPAGLTVVSAATLTAGAGVPDAATAAAALGDEPFEFIALPWTDTTTLDAWAAVMDDAAGRWAFTKQLYGHVYAARRGTLGELVAFMGARNDQHATIQAIEVKAPCPAWVHAAALMARTAVFISADASRPTQTGTLEGVQPAPPSARWTLTERQSLLTYGCATAYYEGGKMRIQRSVTTYQKNAFGQADNSYLDSETLHQIAYVLRYLRGVITSKYARHKLANDGTKFGAGQPIATPSTLRAELVAAYDALERGGHVENSEAFAAHLVVERAANDPSRVNVLFPPDYINGLRVFAVLNQFRLQYAE